VSYGVSTVDWADPTVAGHVAATSSRGAPLWIRVRAQGALGPVAVHPDGRVAMIDAVGPSEEYPLLRWPMLCGPRVIVWNLDGSEASRSPLARCGPEPDPALDAPWWSSLVAGPDGELWVLGDATGPFELAGRAYAPSGRDVFLSRLAPVAPGTR
jgi:hypothetical protein